MAVVVTPLKVADLTQGKLDGTGSFDVLMRAVDEHLLSQFTSNRIKGADYASAYVNSLQAVLAQVTAFELQRQTSVAQAELLANH